MTLAVRKRIEEGIYTQLMARRASVRLPKQAIRVCSFCGGEVSPQSFLVTGYHGARICSPCITTLSAVIAQCEGAIQSDTAESRENESTFAATRTSSTRRLFTGRTRGQVRARSSGSPR